MGIPVIRGVIDRRILVNFRADPAVVAELLPVPFRPQVIHGVTMVGICLIRLKHIRPRFVPAWLGISSENAAHRVAVEWEEEGTVRQGVFIRRRDTSSWLNALSGGWLFPGLHHHARFQVNESASRFEIAVRSDDGATNLALRARRTEKLPATSVFATLAEASAFFQSGSLGYSTTHSPTRFQGLELHCLDWKVEALDMEEVRSSYFADETVFPRGSIAFDNALLMRGVEHEWHGREDLCLCTDSPSPRLEALPRIERAAIGIHDVRAAG